MIEFFNHGTQWGASRPLSPTLLLDLRLEAGYTFAAFGGGGGGDSFRQTPWGLLGACNHRAFQHRHTFDKQVRHHWALVYVNTAANHTGFEPGTLVSQVTHPTHVETEREPQGNGTKKHFWFYKYFQLLWISYILIIYMFQYPRNFLL